MELFKQYSKRLSTPTQQRSFARIVPHKLRRVNPNHPRIHHTDSPLTVMRKSIRTHNHKRVSRRKHRNYHQQPTRTPTHSRTNHINLSAVFGVLMATVALVLSRSSSGTTQTSRTHSHTSNSHPPGQSQEKAIADLLIQKMENKLPAALNELVRLGKKKEHWVWWVFPTELKGGGEPPPKTCVYRSTAEYVVEKAPDVWFKVLKKIEELLNNTNNTAFVHSLAADIGRMKHFVKFWQPIAEEMKNKHSKKHRWRSIKDVCLAISNNIK